MLRPLKLDYFFSSFRAAIARRLHVTGTLGICGSDRPTPCEFPVPGHWAEATKCFEISDLNAFANLTGDHNDIHKLGSRLSPSTPMVHGLLAASLFPAIFSTAFPGAIYRSQDLKFRLPISAGEVVIGRINVLRVRLLKKGHAGKKLTVLEA